jgi:hypothetical protein
LQHDGSAKALSMIAHFTALASRSPAEKVTKEWSQSKVARLGTKKARRRGQPPRIGVKERKACFKGDSLYQEIFPEFDYITRFTADPAHEWGNFWIRLMSLISNTGQNRMTLTRWAKENAKLGRYNDYE